MANGLIVVGTASEVEDLLMTAFRNAAKAGDSIGTAALSKELRKREKAANKQKKKAAPAKDGMCSV